MIDNLVPWEDFRPVLETVWRKPKRERRSAAGRKPWDAVLMFKAIVLGALHNLSDEGLEHEIGDRLTFMASSWAVGLQDWVGRTPRRYGRTGNGWSQAGIVEELFDRFDSFLRARGYEAKGGQIVDASDRGGAEATQPQGGGCADQGWRGAGGRCLRGFF